MGVISKEIDITSESDTFSSVSQEEETPPVAIAEQPEVQKVENPPVAPPQEWFKAVSATLINIKKGRKVIAKKRTPKMNIIKLQTKGQAKYKCKLCDARFDKAVQLGGHSSKFHPGKSETYRKKMEIRNGNQKDRDFLKQAKEWFEAKTELDPRQFRDRITKIKNILRKGDTPNVEDFNKIKP